MIASSSGCPRAATSRELAGLAEASTKSAESAARRVAARSAQSASPAPLRPPGPAARPERSWRFERRWMIGVVAVLGQFVEALCGAGR
jgi:hypothetical protein